VRALILMDCRVIRPVAAGADAGRDKTGRKRMRLKTSAYLLTLSLVLPMLGGCLERGQPTMVDASTDDDAFCRANNVQQGSAEYVACRKDRDVQRQRVEARADRRQRDLGEYMLNNPTKP